MRSNTFLLNKQNKIRRKILIKQIILNSKDFPSIFFVTFSPRQILRKSEYMLLKMFLDPNIAARKFCLGKMNIGGGGGGGGSRPPNCSPLIAHLRYIFLCLVVV